MYPVLWSVMEFLNVLTKLMNLILRHDNLPHNLFTYTCSDYLGRYLKV